MNALGWMKRNKNQLEMTMSCSSAERKKDVTKPAKACCLGGNQAGKSPASGEVSYLAVSSHRSSRTPECEKV